MIYLIGSLRNLEVPKIAARMRQAGLEVFDDWYAAGPEADDCWRDYEKEKGHSYKEALAGAAARNVFDFDKRHLDAASTVVLCLPAGRSGHLELGYCIGRGKKAYILIDSPERWDVMYQFATGIYTDLEELIDEIKPPADQLSEIWYSPTRICPPVVFHIPRCIDPVCVGDCGRS